MNTKTGNYIRILNARILNCSLEEMVSVSEKAIITRRQIFGTGINLNQIYLLKNNKEFAAAIDKARLCPPDGTPIMWISKWMGSPLKQKVVGPDLTLALCKLAAEKQYKVFVLGGKEGSAEIALDNIKKMYGVFKSEYYCPPFGFEKDLVETEKIVKKLKDSGADILLMALSAPKQEIFVEKYRREFEIPVIFGAGIAIDYFAGRIKQAPKWINRTGMEWAYRMVQEPGRLIERYIIHDLPVLIDMRKWALAYKRTNRLSKQCEE